MLRARITMKATLSRMPTCLHLPSNKLFLAGVDPFLE